ncbi:MAG: CPBP family intramembrane glutamic endopeptidase [Candidatus Thorarchaeota archaeon]
MTVLQDYATEERVSIWSRMNLLEIGAAMLAFAALIRVIDILVLGLGDTWINIMPSKIIPLVVLISLFWIYRNHEIRSVLGLSQTALQRNILLGAVLGITMYLLMDTIPVIIFGSFIDPSYPLEFHVLVPDLLWYQFLFFLTNAVLEETLFRGLLQNGLSQRYTSGRAILYSALIFAAWHMIWPFVNGPAVTPGQTVAMLLFSVIFASFMGVYYEKFTRRTSLVGPIVAHTLVNFFNEGFRIGPEPVIQGPDVVYSSPALLSVTMVMFFVTMTVLFVGAFRFRIDQFAISATSITNTLRRTLPVWLILGASVITYWVLNTMQLAIDIVNLSVIVTISLSALMALFLFRIWLNQERRLNTDLPLMFGITFIAQAINNFIRMLPMIGVVEMTMELFRLRAGIIYGTSFPLLGVVLHIWFPKIRKYHARILALLTVYWMAGVLLGPTEQVIMILHMPIILVLTIGMLVTFLVTWRTGRLKEVRSDLMVLSFAIGIASQIVATVVLLNNLLTSLATMIATLGLVNPWKEKYKDAETPETPTMTHQNSNTHLD